MDADEEKLIVRYLLGEMEEEKRDRFEAIYFSSDESVEKLEMARDLLIDRYTAGSLSLPERERFESHFLDSPHHRQRLTFARALMAAVETEDENTSVWLSVREFLKAHNRALIIATSLLLVTAGFFLFRAFFAPKPASQQTATNDANSQTAVAPQETPDRNADQNRSSDERKKEDSKSLTASLFLTLAYRGRDRGEANRLVIAENIVSVHLTVTRPAGYKSYTASIRPVGGEEIWSQKLGDGSSPTVTMKIPAKLFSSQDYNLVVRGEADGRAEDIDGYYFRVERKP